MAIQDKPTLKSYFETGDRPTQAQFGDLIDTLVAQTTQGVISVGAINLDTAAAPTGQEGQIRWNATDKCAEVVQDGGVILQVGQEITVRARNTTGSTLANGTPVYVVGATGNRPTIARADADAFATSSTLIGLVTDSAGIANNGDGHVTVFGMVRDVDTSAYAEGATLYLSDGTSGTLTATKPTATSSFVVRVGYVLRSHASQGVILVSPQYLGSVTGDAVVNATTQAAARTAIDAPKSDLSDAASLPNIGFATHRYVRRIGADYTSGGASTGAPLLALSPRRLPQGRVVNVRTFNAGTGNFKVCLVRPDGAGNVTIVERSADIAGTSGTQTLIAGVDFPAWILDGNLEIAIQTGTSGAPGLRFDNSIGEGYQVFIGTASGTVAMSNTAGGTLFYTVDVAAEEPRRGGATLEWTDFGCAPVGWTNGGSTWTFSPVTRAATSGTVGLANQLRTGLRYGIDKRTLRWEFTLNSGTSIAAFLTNPVEGGVQSGSLVYVDANAQQIQIYGRYTGSNTPSLITSTSCALSSGVRYVFEWTKSGRSYTAAVKTMGGTTVATITRTATPWGYSTYPSFGYDQGTLQGAPGVAAIAGSVTVFNFDHRAVCMVNPDLYILGDSITEGFGVTDAQKWPTLVENTLGFSRVAYSGIGGATTTSALGRITSEISSLRPRNVLIYLGTNPDASFAANIVTMAYAAQQLGANVYFATVPTSSTNTTSVNGLAAWIRKIRFDVALTTGGAGTSLVTASYTNTDANGNSYNDSLHPNAAGNLAMYNRIVTDAPELLAPL